MASPSYHGNGPHFPSFARTSLEKDVDADLQLARKCRNGRVIWVSGLVAQTILLPCVLILWVMTYTDAVHECTTPSVVTSWSCGRVCQLVSDVSEHKHCTQMSFGSSLLDCCLPMEWDLYTYILCGLIGLGILRTILSILISVCCRKRGCNIFLHASLTTQRFHVAFQVLLDVCLVALSAFMYTTFRHALALHAIIIILGMGGLAFVLLSFDLYGIFRALSSARASLFVGPFRVFTIDDVSQGLHINELRFGAMDGTETSHLGSESYLKPDEISNYSYLP